MIENLKIQQAATDPDNQMRLIYNHKNGFTGTTPLATVRARIQNQLNE